MGIARTSAIFLLLILFFYLTEFSTKHLTGLDIYYHLRIAELTGENGLLTELPWMQETTFKEKFADNHLLLHLLLLPFTTEESAKMFIIITSSLMLAILYHILTKFEVKHAIIWIAMLLTSRNLLIRLSLGRAEVITLAIIPILAYVLLKNKEKILIPLFYISTISHSTYLLMLLMPLFYSIQKRKVKPVLYALIGIMLGIIINPYFPQNIQAQYLQVIKTPLQDATMRASELSPLDLNTLLKLNIAVVIFYPLGIISFLKNKNKNAFLLLTSLIFLAISLMSQRFITYWIITGIIFSAIELKELNRISITYIFIATIIISYYAYITQVDQKQYEASQRQYKKVDYLKQCSDYLKQATPEKSIVFHSWSSFPYLFYYNTHNYYLVGLDPVFMTKEKQEIYDKLLTGDETNICIIKELFKTDYILLDATTYYQKAIDNIEQSSCTQYLYGNEYCAVYKLI